jgi:metal-responsive CopG/Arc/MetJ family transcriptional regulator
MRTTVTLDKDVAAAVKRLRREDGLGVSEALNQIARAGLAQKEARTPFRQRTVKMGLLVDVSNVAEAIELAEGASHR